MKNNVDKSGLVNAANRIYSAEQNDIACDDAAALMAGIVDNQYEGVDLKTVAPELARHFSVCIDCAAEYEMVLSMAQLIASSGEENDQTVQIPPRPDTGSGMKSIRDFLGSVFDFPGFKEVGAAAVRGAGLNVEPVEIKLNPGLTLEIDLALNSNNGTLRDMFISLTAENSDQQAEFEGISVWLADVKSEKRVATGMLDKYGEAVLPAVESGEDYFLQIELPAQLSRIQPIKVP